MAALHLTMNYGKELCSRAKTPSDEKPLNPINPMAQISLQKTINLDALIRTAIPLLLAWCISTLALPSFLFAQTADLSFLLTTPERTSFQETTRYDEANAFLEVAVSQHPMLHKTSFGYSNEGRSLPLVVFGDIADARPESVMQSGKLRVFVQGNIHAGEVCGKEALLMLIRSLASGEHASWADSLVLIMAPIYNADGNELVNLYNRPRQNGPFGGMGQRPNAEGLDLNRDHMKMKSPEARSLIRFMNEYDPHVSVDLHTTNGTRHGYMLTYSPALNPNTDSSIDELLRNELLPQVRQNVMEDTGWDTYYYGNLPFRRAEAGWYTFDHRPRFNNNYIGLRNRIPILSEAYAYATFEDRILVTLKFVEEIVNYASRNVSTLQEVILHADKATNPGLVQGLHFVPVMNSEATDIRMGAAEERVNPFSGSTILHRTDSTWFQSMPEFGAFSPTETSSIPAAWVVSAEAAEIVGAALSAHGVHYETIKSATDRTVSSFTVDSTSVAERAFQQINERVVFGTWDKKDLVLSPGSLLVSGNQPLARLAFYLLEPRSDDGLLNWAMLDKWIDAGATYPVMRIDP